MLPPSTAEEMAVRLHRIQFLNKLVSREYDPVAFNCWTFVRLVQQELFSRFLPDVGKIDPTNAQQVANVFASHPEKLSWYRVDPPKDGSVVLMTRKATPHVRETHAGVYLENDGPGAIWHVDAPHGLVVESPLEVVEVRRWTLTYYERIP